MKQNAVFSSTLPSSSEPKRPSGVIATATNSTTAWNDEAASAPTSKQSTAWNDEAASAPTSKQSSKQPSTSMTVNLAETLRWKKNKNRGRKRRFAKPFQKLTMSFNSGRRENNNSSDSSSRLWFETKSSSRLHISRSEIYRPPSELTGFGDEYSVTDTESCCSSPLGSVVEEQHVQKHQVKSQLGDNRKNYHFRNFINQSLDGTSKLRKASFLSKKSKQRLSDAIHKDYTEVLIRKASLGELGTRIHLDAADHLVQEFVSVQDVMRCSAMGLSIQEMVYGTLEGYIFPRIADRYRIRITNGDLRPSEAAELVSWFDCYLKTIKSVHSNVKPSSKWYTDRNLLLDLYLNSGVRRKMKEQLQGNCSNLLCDDAIQPNQEKNLVTNFPNQIAFFISKHLSAAEESLPGKYIEQVFAACNYELSEWVGTQMLEIGSNWKEISPSHYCAIMNDTSRLVDECEERNAIYLTTPKHVEAGEALCNEMADLVIHAATFLSENMMWRLREPAPILTTVGDQTWEEDEKGNTISRTTATLKDYLRDLEKWLTDDYYYPKVLRSCFDLTVQTYIESFFTNTMVHGVRDPERVSRQLNEDYLGLVVFFNGSSFERYQGVAGFDDQHQVNSRLETIQCMSKIVDPSHAPENLVNEVKVILTRLRCRENGTPAVLHLAGLRGQHTNEESIEWLRVIALANKTGSQDNMDGLSNEFQSQILTYTVPDLRNSNPMRNCPANTSTRIRMSRRISEASLPLAMKANTLLQPKHVALRRIHRARSRVAKAFTLA